MSIEGRWIIESMLVDGGLAPQIEGTEIILDVEGDRVSDDANNRFMAGLGENTLFGMMAATRMTGPPGNNEPGTGVLQSSPACWLLRGRSDEPHGRR
ncbi:MAG: hypothetical protein WD269_02355 [Acidimicrobiia bacterium]